MVLIDPQKQSRGELVIEVLPEWAPLAAARFKELVELGFYKRTRFHRVLQGFLPGDLSIAQFGISTSRELNTEWLCKTCKPLPDEARRQSNAKGTLSFAQASQKNTRQTQVFINLADNGGVPSFLDGPFPLGQEFAPFARVVGGMELLPKLHGEASVDQGKAAYYGEEYLDEVFPKLSVIEDVKLIL
jgi:cyclophilin family peptidyl-prolyl cis-trans isomerase